MEMVLFLVMDLLATFGLTALIHSLMSSRRLG